MNKFFKFSKKEQTYHWNKLKQLYRSAYSKDSIVELEANEDTQNKKLDSKEENQL